MVRDFTGVGLAEARRLVDESGSELLSDVTHERAVAMLERLEEVGATASMVRKATTIPALDP